MGHFEGVYLFNKDTKRYTLFFQPIFEMISNGALPVMEAAVVYRGKPVLVKRADNEIGYLVPQRSEADGRQTQEALLRQVRPRGRVQTEVPERLELGDS